MNDQLEYLSDHLKAARDRMTDCRHGGLVLTGDELEETIRQFNDFVSMARRLECEISRREWNSRAERDRRALINEQSAAVLEAMRSPASNVFAFPVKSGTSPADQFKG